MGLMVDREEVLRQIDIGKGCATVADGGSILMYLLELGRKIRELPTTYLVHCGECKYYSELCVKDGVSAEDYCSCGCRNGKELELVSYDISLAVKVDGTSIYANIATPELSDPTFNLREMFVACMNWDYSLGIYYPCKEVAEKVERGIKELYKFPEKYDKFNSPNGWGDRRGAIETLESLETCIEETTREIPIEHLYMTWGD